MIVHFEHGSDRRGPHRLTATDAIRLTEAFPGLPDRDRLHVIFEGHDATGEAMICIRIVSEDPAAKHN